MSDEIIVRETASPLSLMQTAVEKGFDTEQLKILFDLHNKHNENMARQAFAAAKCETQRLATAVVRSSDNPQTRSRYANLEAIDRMIRPIYTEQGLALDFSEDDCPLEGNMRVRLIATHKLGHQEERHIDLPIDGAGIKGTANKTATHAKASTFTYGQRYLTVAFFNIPLSNDDDGNGGRKFNPQTPTEVNTKLRAGAVVVLNGAADESFEQFVKTVNEQSDPVFQACKGDVRDIALKFFDPMAKNAGYEVMKDMWSKAGKRIQQACKDDLKSLQDAARESDRKKEKASA